MLRAQPIDAAFEVDEAKDIRDKAVAMEAYFKQAKNTEAERRACEIRLRAERKAGKLLSKMEKNKGGGDRKSDHPSRGTTGDKSTLSDLGITRDQSSRWQSLAGVPTEEFEAAFASEKKPSTSGIIAKPRKMPATSLWPWGRLSPKFSMS